MTKIMDTGVMGLPETQFQDSCCSKLYLLHHKFLFHKSIYVFNSINSSTTKKLIIK